MSMGSFGQTGQADIRKYEGALRRRLGGGNNGPTGGVKNLAPSGNTRAGSIIRRTRGGKMTSALKNLRTP